MFQIIKDDGWLAPYEFDIQARYDRFHKTLKWIKEEYSTLKKYASFHQYLGFQYDNNKGGWYYREWAPGADALFLIGDFNDWDREGHQMYQKGDGIWEIFLPDENNQSILRHEQLLKVQIHSNGQVRDRVPVYMTRVFQNTETHLFA